MTKGRGAGFLAFPERLDLFLEEVFQNCPIDISVKTRIGTESGEEFPKLMDIYNKYPIKELIIHPRTQKDFYKNIPHMDVFEKALAQEGIKYVITEILHRKKMSVIFRNSFRK